MDTTPQEESYWEHEMCEEPDEPDECGMGISTGGFDPYGTSCDLPPGHKGPHEGPDFFGCGRLRWEGGGYCAGDPLPFNILTHIEED